jgi:hypothetical protein
MSTFDDDELYRDNPAEPWTTPVEPRKTLRETNPLPITPHYPPSVMVATSFGFHVPRHLRERCENAYHDAKDRMRVRGEEAESENGPQMASGASVSSPVAHNIALANSEQPERFQTPLRASPKPRLLGWEPPPPDHVEAYLRAGGS